MTDGKALPIMTDIEGDKGSARQQAFFEVLLADWCDTE